MAKVSIKVARRYARALFESCDKSKLDACNQSMHELAKLWQDSVQLRNSMLNPGFPVDQRRAAALDLAKRIAPQDNIFHNFVTTVIENGRQTSLPHIAQSFSEIIDEYKKVLALEVVSAFDLPGEERGRIEEKIRGECGSSAKITWRTDKSILGGLVVKAGDKLLDASIAGSLQRLSSNLI